jgi:hypothetical protein
MTETTTLARLTEVLRRARMRGDWDDESVVLEVLAEMRVGDDAMMFAGSRSLENEMQAPSATLMGVGFAAMIDAIRADATEPATCPLTG